VTGSVAWFSTSRVAFEHRPAARTQGLLPLLQALAGGGRAAGVAGLGDVVAAADQLVHLARPGSLIFILSDFNQLTPERSAWLARLGRANEVVLVHVRDPLEELAPPPGLYPVTDGLRRGLLDTGVEARRSAWQGRFRDHLEMLEGLARQHRAHLLWLSTAEPVGPALARGLNPRRAGGGR
jgi:hypothetical protein